MKIPMFQVDAFADRAFGGNPAAVCLLDAWLSDTMMQAIAAENNLSETAFCVAEGNGYRLRWFTPVREVDLCGHATLATAHVLYADGHNAGDPIRFATKSGELTVSQDGELLAMDFPAVPGAPVDVPPDYMLVFRSEADIRRLEPNMAGLAEIDLRGVIVTAPGDACDFVSRFFAPGYGIPEDPVTGSAHCTLTPYWAGRLKKTNLHARQLSERGGELFCRQDGERVHIAGRAALYLRGEITI